MIQSENAFCKNGILIIEARKEQKTNPCMLKAVKNGVEKLKTFDIYQLVQSPKTCKAGNMGDLK